mgnify:CR=1 FL=1
MTHTCLICEEDATKIIRTSLDQGELYLCSNDKCKDTLEDQLMSI